MIQVRMRQYDRIDVLGFNGQALPIKFAQVFQSLEQSAVDQDAGTAICDQVFGAGDGTGTAQAGQ
jgi:ribosomal protein RSM22 (predicted rRNA methylase)